MRHVKWRAEPFAFDGAGLDLLRTAAEKNARCCGLGHDESEDLAQSAAVELSKALAEGAHPTNSDAEEIVRRLASAERAASRRDRRLRCQLIQGQRRGREATLPALCPHLETLADAHASPLSFRRRLMAAALLLARDPRILNAEQFRIFYLCWIEHVHPTRIAEMLAVSPRAAKQRLHRVSKRVEHSLVHGVRPLMSRRESSRILDALVSGAVSSRGACESIYVAMGTFLHNSR